jgi:hypothetical protein
MHPGLQGNEPHVQQTEECRNEGKYQIYDKNEIVEKTELRQKGCG